MRYWRGGEPKAESASPPEPMVLSKSLSWKPLRKRSDFLALRAEGEKLVERGFILQLKRQSEPQASMRIGFTATRKLGNAVMRNRVKRRLRALAGEILCHEGEPSCDYVLIGRYNTCSRDFNALCCDLRNALKRGHKALRKETHERA